MSNMVSGIINLTFVFSSHQKHIIEKKVFYTVLVAISRFDTTAMIQLSALLFGFIRYKSQEENTRLVTERSDIMITQNSILASKISDLIDNFDPPLFKSFSNDSSVKKSIAYSEIQEKFEASRPNLTSAGFKLQTRTSKKVTSMSEITDNMNDEYY